MQHPCGPQVPLQHSAPASQLEPSERPSGVGQQKLSVQLPVQHCRLSVQAKIPVPQQPPSTQLPGQQSSSL